jgi:hypothetical protein
LLCTISNIQVLLFGWEGKRETEDRLMSQTMWLSRGWVVPKAHAAAAVPSAWPRMRQVILYALAEFPEARAAVAAAIREFVSEDEA